MQSNLVRIACAALALCAAPAASRAQGFDGGYASRERPLALVDRGLTLPRGSLEIWAPLGVNISNGAGGEPTFLNPSISYGVTDRFTFGVRHFLGICFNDEDAGCPEFYNDVSFDALYSLVSSGRLQIAGGAALNLAPITDPTAVAGEVRLPVKFGGGKLALVVAPTLNFGLNERDDRKRYAMSFNAGTYDVIFPSDVSRNREVIRVPLTVQVQATPSVAVIGGASIDGETDPAVGSFGDVYRVPLLFGLLFAPSSSFDLGASFLFPDLMGENGTADDRLLNVFVALRI